MNKPELFPLVCLAYFTSIHFPPATFSNLSTLTRQLMATFWPGPLTLILPNQGLFATAVTAGLSSVAVRVPDHPVAAELLHQATIPVAAPSANRSGRPSPTRADHAQRDLSGRVAHVLDGGATEVGLESTVLDLSDEVPTILRPGAVTYEQLQKVLGRVATIHTYLESGQPRSPGMKYRHYAPQGEMWLVGGANQAMRQEIQQRAQSAMKEGKRVGILTTEEFQDEYQATFVVACGSRMDAASVAHQLYQTLHRFDQADMDLILSETFPQREGFTAVMNRLDKAAGGKWIDVK